MRTVNVNKNRIEDVVYALRRLSCDVDDLIPPDEYLAGVPKQVDSRTKLSDQEVVNIYRVAEDLVKRGRGKGEVDMLLSDLYGVSMRTIRAIRSGHRNRFGRILDLAGV